MANNITTGMKTETQQFENMNPAKAKYNLIAITANNDEYFTAKAAMLTNRC